MSAHTPGPWSLWEVDSHVVIGPDAHRVATASGGKAHAEANARLIAAAPEMAAALRGLTPVRKPEAKDPCHFGVCEMSECANCQRIFAARAALQKAGVNYGTLQGNDSGIARGSESPWERREWHSGGRERLEDRRIRGD
jgi:hypothetical protein